MFSGHKKGNMEKKATKLAIGQIVILDTKKELHILSLNVL